MKFLFVLFTAVAVHAENFSGIVHLNGCSGSLVRTSLSSGADRALILSAGHCVPFALDYYQYATHYKNTSNVTFLNADGTDSKFTAVSTEIIYATMTGTDASLYALTETYDQIEKRTGIKALTLASQSPQAGKAITVLSGQLHKAYHCSIAYVTPYLVEGDYIWNDSLRYSPQGCEVVGGTSGAPVLDDLTGLVIGVNNTGNEGYGEACDSSAPCEVDEKGNMTTLIPSYYAQQVSQITTCFNSRREFDLQTSGCSLFH